MNGVLVVDKPAGPTSHDVVGRVRRALGTRRVGHTGTLDPLATGVLPLVVGQATRLARFLSADDKEYLADVRFGVATATYDAAGGAGGGDSAPVDLSGLDAALEAFRGTYRQQPPAFSAKKVGGTPAYQLARAGKAPELQPVEVTVSLLEVVERTDRTARLRVVCSSGFYVRALAHELGQRLGCGAHLSGLRRTRAGSFGIDAAAPLETVEAEGPGAGARLIPLARLLPELPSVVLDADGARRARHGNRLAAGDQGPAEVPGASRGDLPGRLPVRLFDESGGLLGIAEREPGGVLHPVIVLV